MSSDYTIEIDNISKEEWANVLMQFEDANIYQTWEYGSFKWGEKNLAHLILKKSENIFTPLGCITSQLPWILKSYEWKRTAPIADVSWGSSGTFTFTSSISDKDFTNPMSFAPPPIKAHSSSRPILSTWLRIINANAL